MSLPIWPPYPPMEGTSAKEIPSGPQSQYEPKWDGLRCVAFRDGSRVELQSKAMKPLARYFPELVAALKDLKAKTVGSLLLGLYNQNGLLDHVGFAATGKNFGTEELTRIFERLIKPPGFTGKAPGGPSRWSTERSSKWEPLRAKLVVEVQFDHVTGGRFRHGTKFLRWRPDKAPAQCTCDQIAVSSGSPLLLVWSPRQVAAVRR